MKKFILIFFIAFSNFVGYSQLNEGFEGATFPPTGWLVKDNRTDSAPNWGFNVNPYLPNTGTHAAFINRENTGAGVLSEEWLITSQVTLAANSQLRFFTRQTLAGDTGTLYQVRVSSSANQSDLASYSTILAEYTETELSTITADQLDYEEKVINLSFTGPRYFAFVKVFTQPGAATSGDRWLIDDVKTVVRCTNPSNLGATNINATNATLTWTGASPQYNIIWGESGFDPLISGTTVTGLTAATYTFPSGTLNPSTAYQYYVTGVCPDSNSDLIGPFNFNTRALGSTCASAIPVTSLPYSNASNTTIYGNNITAATPGNTGCGTTGAYLGGNDVVYSYTATADGFITISMNPNGATNTGMFVYSSCPSIGVSCLAGVGNTNSNIRTIQTLQVTSGLTYYIVLSSTTATPTYDYNLIIQNVTCAAPVTLSASAFGTSSGTFSWVNGATSTATSWEVAIQPAGSTIPTGAGVQTNTNTNYPVSGLTPGTAYQYWVRADCTGGLFSPWSGPFLFNTSLCELVDQCNYTFTLSDTGGNGWENGRMQVKQNGVVIVTLGATITTGGPTAVTVPMCNNQPFELFWSVAGTTPSEIRVSIKNSFSQTVYALTTASPGLAGTSLYTGTVDCLNANCLAPTAVNANTITTNGATVTWTTSGVPTIGWGIYVVPVGDPAPTPSTPPTYTTPTAPPYLLTGLQPDTAYNIYVQSICSVNGPSGYAGPKNIRTLPTCPKPTALTATLITPFTAQLGWTSTAASTSWLVIAVPAGSPIPLPTDPAWIPAPTNPFVYPGLTPETAYEYYVRGDCGANGISTISGPKAFTTLPTCPKPTALTATLIGPHQAQLGWTSTAASTSWLVIAVPTGSPVPLPSDPNWVPAPTNPFVLTGLTAETAYDYYVRGDCGPVNGLSSISGPKAFTTTPTCFKPTALTVTTITDVSAQLGWTNVGNTSWQVLVLPAGSPAPTASSTGWVATTNNPYIALGLTPATCYDYYVRTDCGATDGLSTWSGPKNFCTTICNPVSQCNYTFSLTDSFGDGWNGATMQVRQNGIVVATIGSTFTAGAGPINITVPLCTGVPFDLFWNTPGTFPTEVRVSITNSFSQVLFNMNTASAALAGTVIYTDSAADCQFPKCLPPSGLTATPSIFSSLLDWTPAGNNTTWDVYVLPTGSPAPTALSTPTYPGVTTHPFNATGLNPSTTYQYYIRALCDVGNPGDIVGPFEFTTLPTCPQPINLNYVATNTNSADLIWTELGPATSWQIVVQPSGGTAPGATSGQVVSTLPTTTTPYNTLAQFGALTPGFYEFYVRSNCTSSDQSLWSGPFNFYITVASPVCASVDVTVATTSPGQIDLCPGNNCVDLSASFTDSGDTTTYNVLPVAFAPPFPFTGGTQLPINTDDIWSAPFTLPFNFCFFGVNYPSINVGSNGVLTFTPQVANSNCPWSYTQSLPDPTLPITNAIYGVYQDINPAVSTDPIVHSINYQVLGTAPCRAFVVNYYNVGQFSCGTSVGLQTSQIVLYETSNVIEVYVQDRTTCAGWNGGRGLIGIQNTAGTQAHFPPDRNTGQWEAHNEAWRFTPAGASNVAFSWLKDGVFYSNSPTINVCVSETTNMTAQAIYTGCGGQTTTKTDDVLLHIAPLVIPPMANVNACTTYTLPVLTVGNYFSQPGGVGPIDPLTPITALGTTTIYVYATSGTAPVCTAEISFTVTIGELVAPTPVDVTSCLTYTLPPLDQPFNYYTLPNGGGTMHTGAGGDVITSSQTLYIYGQSGVCTAQSSFVITIDSVTLATQANVSDCSGFTLPTLPANNTYYTQTGGPNGTGTVIAAGTLINTTQTIYIFAQSGTCSDQSSFTVTVNGVDAPTLAITQATCAVTTGSATVTAPVGGSGGTLPTNLFISEVTDEDVGSLTYIELFNGTGAPIDLSNYKIKIYNNGNATTSCDLALSGTIANNATNVIKVSSNADQGGVVANQAFPSCGGVNTNDNIRLTTSSDVEIDIWGRTDGVDFTPNNQTGYTYRRLTTAVAPSTTWNDTEWTAIDPQDYTDVGHYPAIVTTSNYEYNIDNGTWQSSTQFNTIAIGTHTICVRDIATTCVACTTFEIAPTTTNVPVTGFTYTTPVCPNNPNLLPTTATGFATGGTYSSTSGLSISATTGEINVIASTPGTYNVTYSVAQDLANCMQAGSTTFAVTINPGLTPDFAPIAAFCAGTVAPVLGTTSPNGIPGTWSPSTIDNGTSGCYVFTPDPNLCAATQTLCVTVNASITPDFAAIAPICQGLTAPALGATSPNGISGTWSPATIQTTTVGFSDYVFTPNVATVPSPNLLVNGDFSAGNTGFTSDYQFLTVTIPVGQQKTYGVVSNPNGWFPGFAACPDHTSGTGNMMVADGSTSNGGNDSLWSQTIPVTPGEDYTFSYYLESVVAQNPAQIDVVINGTVVGSATAGATACTWVQYSYVWNSGANSSAQISLYDRNLLSAGNDFAIDDLSFNKNGNLCAVPQTLTVEITAPNIDPGFAAISPICSGTAVPSLSTTSPASITGSWSPATISNTQSGSYVFTPDPGQCATTQTLNIVISAPSIDPGFAAIGPICSGTAVPTLSTTSPAPASITGSWSPATISNTQSGSYVFTPDPGQCATTQTLNIVISAPSIDPGFANIAPICAGGSVPTLNTTSPSPASITGTWSPATISNSENGSYVFTPDPGQCATTQTLSVTITPNPVFAINGGCKNGSYVLEVAPTGFDVETTTFIWRDSAGTIVGENAPQLIVTSAGAYTCEIIDQGCSSIEPFTATTISCTIQKGISPKGVGPGDNLNDYFDLEGLNVKKLEIFNRYGTKVYTKANYSKEWYGQSDKGDELPDGTYYYVIERNNVPNKTGWIYINREQ